ncbi:MAG: hypothetical protein NT018_04485 [Armatimonadetes bacterium]|nr:hypothetical protein [Armatimonadota bacterium]
MINGIQKIAIIDDKRDEVMLTGIMLQRVGFEPIPFSEPVQMNDLIERILKTADAALCDNYLQPGGFDFSGAEVMAELYKLKFPAVLVSQYLQQDLEVSIRKERRSIPVALSKDDVDGDSIIEGLKICANEHRDMILPTRRPCRTLIQIARVKDEDGEKVLDAFVVSRGSKRAVRFPASLMGQLAERVERDDYYIVRSNTGATLDTDLFFYDFEIAPEPPTEEEIAQSNNP